MDLWELRAMMDDADQDGNGQIDFEEFKEASALSTRQCHDPIAQGYVPIHRACTAHGLRSNGILPLYMHETAQAHMGKGWHGR